MKFSDRNTQDNSTDNTASDNTDARWEPIPDEIWFSSPAGGFGMESDWEVTADMQEDEETRLIQPDRQKVEVPSPADAASETPAGQHQDVVPSGTDEEDRLADDAPDGSDGFDATEPSDGAPMNPGSPSEDEELSEEATRLLSDVPTKHISQDDPTVLASPIADAAAEAADRTTVVGGGNPYLVTQRRQTPASDHTQVWAAPYAGQAGYGAPSAGDTATAKRPSILKRRKQEEISFSTVPGYNTDSAASDGSPVPAADGSKWRRRRERKPARHGCLSLFLWLVMLVVAGLMLLRTLSAEQANGSMVPELVAFTPLLFVPIIVCLLLALLWHRRLLAVGCFVALAIMFWWHAGFFIPSARVSSDAVAAAASSPSTGDNVARIMTVNTNNGMASAQEIVDICREQNVEILCLQELGGSMLDDLEAAGIDEVLPYSIVSDQATEISNGGRNGIWSAAPMDNVSTNLLPIKTSSMPAADITVGNQTIRIVSVHPNSPVRGAQDLWDDGLSTIGQLQDYDHSYVIMGDFNSTWDHARFRELLGTSFVDAGEQAGEGFHMTFPSAGPIPPLVELDHILYTKDSGVVVSELSTEKISGTDHMALLGTLETS